MGITKSIKMASKVVGTPTAPSIMLALDFSKFSFMMATATAPSSHSTQSYPALVITRRVIFRVISESSTTNRRWRRGRGTTSGPMFTFTTGCRRDNGAGPPPTAIIASGGRCLALAVSLLCDLLCAVGMCAKLGCCKDRGKAVKMPTEATASGGRWRAASLVNAGGAGVTLPAALPTASLRSPATTFKGHTLLFDPPTPEAVGPAGHLPPCPPWPSISPPWRVSPCLLHRGFFHTTRRSVRAQRCIAGVGSSFCWGGAIVESFAPVAGSSRQPHSLHQVHRQSLPGLQPPSCAAAHQLEQRSPHRPWPRCQ